MKEKAAMLNRARGEVPLIIEGVEHTLCLTLGALAEIEAGLGPARFRNLDAAADLTIADVAVILCALLRGGGHDVTLAALHARQVDVSAATKAIAAAFAAAGLGADAP